MKNIIYISGLIVADQITKCWARVYLVNEPIEVFSFFHLIFVENDGIAFSIPASQFFLIPFTLIILGGLGWWMKTKQCSPLEITAFILIFAGAAGNLIDRILFGKVTDFLSFWSFPVFNLADSFISVGVGVYLYWDLFVKKHPHR